MSSYLAHRRKAFQGGSIIIAHDDATTDDNIGFGSSNLTMGQTPAQNSLLIVIIATRTGTLGDGRHAGHTVINDASAGSWAKLVGYDNLPDDENARCSISMHWKVAPASQDTTITADVTGDEVNAVVLEFTTTGSGWTAGQSAGAGSGSGDTEPTVGPTGSTSAGAKLVICAGVYREAGANEGTYNGCDAGASGVALTNDLGTYGAGAATNEALINLSWDTFTAGGTYETTPSLTGDGLESAHVIGTFNAT